MVSIIINIIITQHAGYASVTGTILTRKKYYWLMGSTTNIKLFSVAIAIAI